MPKFRSYNQQFLIAASLMAGFFNDTIIQRRKHIQGRDYSKPINIKDILQKNIEVPCIFGDRSIILKSLQNHEGALKLPLIVLQSGSIRTDQARIADLHIDLLYQRDQQFSKLPKCHPLYYAYDMRRRRPNPVTIGFQTTIIAKYKQDLDQIMTNFIAVCRPDFYVKWWHPRDKAKPLESQILWDQSLNYKKPEEQPTTRFKYEASTNFTFKTWVFSGLDYQQDAYNLQQDGIIKYFNWFPTVVNGTGVDGTEGYPVLGQIGSSPAGFFAVPADMEFYNDGSDQQGIKNGKYYINNLTQTPSSLYTGDGGIKDVTATADILTWDTFQSRSWSDYQNYCLFDNITNQRGGVKCVYFEGGRPLSSMKVVYPELPSGDFMFRYFYDQGDAKKSGYQDYNDLFGLCFTLSLKPEISYDFQSKTLTISGRAAQENVVATLESKICSESGMIQTVQLNNVPSVYIPEHNLRIRRWFDKDLKSFRFNEKFDDVKTIKILNNTGFMKSQQNVMLLLQMEDWRKRVLGIKAIFQKSWKKLQIYQCDNNGMKTDDMMKLEYAGFHHYRVICQTSRFKKAVQQYGNVQEITTFIQRQQVKREDATYTVIANDYLYFVFSDQDVYDWGVVDLPRFAPDHYPIFQSTDQRCKCIYGVGVDMKIASAVK